MQIRVIIDVNIIFAVVSVTGEIHKIISFTNQDFLQNREFPFVSVDRVDSS